MKTTHGKVSGGGLKPGVNEADTGSVVQVMKGTVSFGKMAPLPKKAMMSANASRKK